MSKNASVNITQPEARMILHAFKVAQNNGFLIEANREPTQLELDRASRIRRKMRDAIHKMEPHDGPR